MWLLCAYLLLTVVICTVSVQLIALVDKILTAKQQGKDTRTLETEIDKMVYRLYDLTDDEIGVIEDNQ